MKKNILPLLTFPFLLLFLVSCSKVAMTDRKQLILIPSAQITNMSFSQYDSFKKTNKLSTNTKDTLMVKRVGARIQKSVEQYLKETNQLHLIKGFQWEFNLFQGDTVNAWCMPGGKVAFYEGILPIAKGENGVATVMGHEIAHAIAKHGSERMSQQLLIQVGGIGLLTALKEKPAQTKQLWMLAYGVGSQYGATLPFSRLHEYEADEMGLMFMAMAGYNPQEAANFWKRMRANKKVQTDADYTSTHPSDSKRIKAIERDLPKAMRYYKASKAK